MARIKTVELRKPPVAEKGKPGKVESTIIQMCDEIDTLRGALGRIANLLVKPTAERVAEALRIAKEER